MTRDEARKELKHHEAGIVELKSTPPENFSGHIVQGEPPAEAHARALRVKQNSFGLMGQKGEHPVMVWHY